MCISKSIQAYRYDGRFSTPWSGENSGNNTFCFLWLLEIDSLIAAPRTCSYFFNNLIRPLAKHTPNLIGNCGNDFCLIKPSNIRSVSSLIKASERMRRILRNVLHRNTDRLITKFGRTLILDGVNEVNEPGLGCRVKFLSVLLQDRCEFRELEEKLNKWSGRDECRHHSGDCSDWSTVFNCNR